MPSAQETRNFVRGHRACPVFIPATRPHLAVARHVQVSSCACLIPSLVHASDGKGLILIVLSKVHRTVLAASKKRYMQIVAKDRQGAPRTGHVFSCLATHYH